MKYYIYCPMYEAIFLVYYLMEQGHEVEAITPNENIALFFNAAGIKVTCFTPVYLKTLDLISPLTFKSKLNRIFKRYDQKIPLIFGHNAFDYNGFYLAKKWAEHNAVFFYRLDPRRELFRIKKIEKQVIFTLFLRWKLRLFCNLNLPVLNCETRSVVGIDEYFLEKNRIQRVELGEAFQAKKKKICEKYYIQQKRYKNLIILEGWYSLPDKVDIDSLDYCYKWIRSHARDCVYKRHPIHRGDDCFFEKQAIYPDYIPAQFLYGNIDKNVIGLSSTSLITASYFKNIKAISLIHLVEWKSKEAKNKFYYFLTEEDNGICFPESYEELEKLIALD